MSVDERVAEAFVAAHPEDAARLLERADPADVAALLASIAPAAAAAAYGALGPRPAAACAAAMDDATLASLVGALPLDAAGAALRQTERPRRDAVLSRLGEERRERLRAGLEYPEGTAGSLADPLVLALAEDMSAADAQKQLRGGERHLHHHVYVVARDRSLVGVLSVPELMAARVKEPLTAVMRRDPVRLAAHTDLATLAVHPAWRDFDSLPVVDSGGRLIGAVRHRTIRSMGGAGGRPMMDTLVGLSELYWAGLTAILASLAGQGSAGSGVTPGDGEGGVGDAT